MLDWSIEGQAVPVFDEYGILVSWRLIAELTVDELEELALVSDHDIS